MPVNVTVTLSVYAPSGSAVRLRAYDSINATADEKAMTESPAGSGQFLYTSTLSLTDNSGPYTWEARVVTAQTQVAYDASVDVAETRRLLGYVASGILSPSIAYAVPSGPNSVTVTFKDASNVVVAGVPFTILGQGSGRAGTSGGSTGVATFGLPNGTYTLTASITSGVTFPDTTLTVSGTTTATVTGATSTLPTSSDPDQCAAYIDCYGRDGAPESGVTLHYQMMIAPATTATSFNRAPDETPASDVAGRLVVTLARNATYDFWRGNGPRQRVVIGSADASKPLPQILSAGGT